MSENKKNIRFEIKECLNDKIVCPYFRSCWQGGKFIPECSRYGYKLLTDCYENDEDYVCYRKPEWCKRIIVVNEE